MVKQVKTGKELEDFVDANKVVLVDFMASWCGPCKRIAPILDAMSSEFEGKVAFVKIDIDDLGDAGDLEGDRAAKLGDSPSGVPTFRVYKDGAKVGELVGASEEKLKELISAHAG